MIGLALARRLTAPVAPRRYPFAIRDATARAVIVDATDQTVVPGTWGLFLADGGHLRVAGVPLVSQKTAQWPIVTGEPPRPGDRAAWSGIAHRSPADIGLEAADELFETPGGIMPAWVIPGGGAGETWAVHVHGMGSTRAGVLRGVRVAAAAGIPSLVVTYRNTLEGARWGTGRSTLGVLEASDVAAQLQHLSRLGARRFVLFGWSMGAQIALRLAADPAWRGRISGLVLDSPVLDWRAAAAANLRHLRLPGGLAGTMAPWLRQPRFTGAGAGIDLRGLDWVRRSSEVDQPTLIFHGTSDWSAPIEVSRSYASARSGVELVETTAGHTVNWNVDREMWDARTRAFLMRYRE